MTWTELFEWMKSAVAEGKGMSTEEVVGRVIACAMTTEAAHAERIAALERKLESLTNRVAHHVIYHPSEDQPLP